MALSDPSLPTGSSSDGFGRASEGAPRDADQSGSELVSFKFGPTSFAQGTVTIVNLGGSPACPSPGVGRDGDIFPGQISYRPVPKGMTFESLFQRASKKPRLS